MGKADDCKNTAERGSAMKTVTDIQKSISENIKRFRAENHMSALDLHEISGAAERAEVCATRSTNKVAKVGQIIQKM